MNSIVNSALAEEWTAELAIIGSNENSRLTSHTGEQERASNSNFDNLIGINHQDASLCYCL